MTIVNSNRASASLVMGWAEDPAVTVRQVAHAVESGHRIGVCGTRVEVTGGPWSSVTPFSRCLVCRQVARGR